MSCQHERTKILWEEPSHSRDIGEINWCIDCGAYRRWSGSENEAAWVQPSRDRETGAPVRFREHADMRQDERLRALERELARSGKSLHEWAAAVLDVQPTVCIPLGGNSTWSGDLPGQTSHFTGMSMVIVNRSFHPVDVNIWMSRRRPDPVRRTEQGQSRRRGRCSSCRMEVEVSLDVSTRLSTRRFLAAVHESAYPGDDGPCLGSEKVVSSLFCYTHHAAPCAAPECRWHVFVPTCSFCDGRGQGCEPCNGTGTVCCGLGGELHTATCDCCQGRCAHAR